jgi:hypothetical protein
MLGKAIATIDYESPPAIRPDACFIAPRGTEPLAGASTDWRSSAAVRMGQIR